MSRGADPNTPTTVSLKDKMAVYADPTLVAMHEDRHKVRVSTSFCVGGTSFPPPTLCLVAH